MCSRHKVDINKSYIPTEVQWPKKPYAYRQSQVFGKRGIKLMLRIARFL
jgi:hypothetical protein